MLGIDKSAMFNEQRVSAGRRGANRRSNWEESGGAGHTETGDWAEIGTENDVALDVATARASVLQQRRLGHAHESLRSA